MKFEINERNATNKAVTTIMRRKEYIINYEKIIPKIQELAETHQEDQNKVFIRIDRKENRILFNTRWYNENFKELMKILMKKYMFTEDKEGINYVPKHHAYSVPTRFFYHLKKDIEQHEFKVKHEWKEKKIDLKKSRTKFDDKYDLWEWQMEADEALEKNNHRGVVEASSGSGKTIFGIYEILKLGVKTAIIVPTEVLALQWEDELNKIGIDPALYYGKSKDIKDITIFIINSATKWIRKRPEWFSLILYDEVHHSAAKSFSRAHDHLAKYSIGISATVDRPDNRHENHILHTIGPKVYELDVPKAIEKGYLATLKLVNVRYQLTKDEWEEYRRIDPVIRRTMAKLAAISGGNPLTALRKKAKTDPTAKKCWKLIMERKTILEKSKAKAPIIEDIILQEPNEKWIVFCELIEQSEAVKEYLSDRFDVGVFHSKMNKRERQTTLTKFENDTTNVLVAVRCLDEGYNVPECKRGIISGGSSTRRQIIQRVGRLLRELSRMGKESKQAILYQLYAGGTKEEDYMNKRTKTLEPEETEWLKW